MAAFPRAPPPRTGDALSLEEEDADLDLRLLRLVFASEVCKRLGLASFFRSGGSPPRPFRILLGLGDKRLLPGLTLLGPKRARGLLAGAGDGLLERLGDMVNRERDLRFLVPAFCAAAGGERCLGLRPRLGPTTGDRLALRVLRKDRDLDRDPRLLWAFLGDPLRRP